MLTSISIRSFPWTSSEALHEHRSWERVRQRSFGRIDVLVNNAGNSVLGNFEELTNADIEKQMRTNFYGVVNVLRAALPILRKQRGGHIINISSTAGAAGFKHCTAYSASKFAVEGLTLSLALEVEQFGIKLTPCRAGILPHQPAGR